MTTLRGVLLLLSGRVTQLLLALVSVRVSTTLLTVEQYGALALLLGFHTFFGLLLINPVGQYIQRHIHQWFSEGSLLSRLRYYNGYVLIVTALAVAMVAGWFSMRGAEGVHTAWRAALAVGMIVYAGTWNGCLVSTLNMVGFHGASVYFAVVSTLAALASAVALTSQEPSGVLWLTGQAAGIGLGCVLALRTLQRQIRPTVRATSNSTLLSWHTVWSFCLPLAMATGFMWALGSGYRFVVEWGWGMRALGYLAVGLGVAGQVWSACETLLMQFFAPHFFKAASGNVQLAQEQAYSNLVNALAPIYLLLLGVTVACGGWILAVLIDAKFHDAYVFVLFGAMIEWCRAMAGLLSQAAQVTKQTTYVIAPYALSGSVAIGGSLVSAWIHAPLEAVAAVLVVAGLLLLFSMGWQMHRLLRVAIEWRSLLSMATLACAIVIGAILVGFEPRPFNESMLALAIVGPTVGLALLIFIKRNGPCRALLAVRLLPSNNMMDQPRAADVI